MDFYSIDTGTGNPDVRMQASGGTVGTNFGGNLSWYGANFYFNGNVNALGNSLTCGGLTINDSSYGNLKLSITM